jgi:hypothetical protein
MSVHGSFFAGLTHHPRRVQGGRREGLPSIRNQGVELLIGGRIADSRKHVGEVLPGLDVVGDAGSDDRVKPSEVGRDPGDARLAASRAPKGEF